MNEELIDRITRCTCLIHKIPQRRNLWRRYSLLWSIRQRARIDLGRRLNGRTIERVGTGERGVA